MEVVDHHVRHSDNLETHTEPIITMVNFRVNNKAGTNELLDSAGPGSSKP
jgi:hypothetical protein